MTISVVSTLVPKGRFYFSDEFGIKACDESLSMEGDWYFCIKAYKRNEQKTFNVVKAAFDYEKFIRLQEVEDQTIGFDYDQEAEDVVHVVFEATMFHPIFGEVVEPIRRSFDDFIIAHPKLIEFAINEKSSLLCYEEY